MRDVRVYYHPSVGDYASYPSFELDYGLAGAGVGGLAVGAGSYALRKAYGGSLLWGLAGALIGGGIGGALVPKKILSWFNPPPFDAPLRYPRQIPKVVVPSFIGDAGQVLNLLMHHGAGDTVRDYSGFGNHGKIFGASWIDGSWGWALSFDGVDDQVVLPDITIPSTPFSLTAWVNCLDVATTNTVISKTGSVAAQTNYWMDIRTGGSIIFGVYDNAQTGRYVVTSPILSNNKWYFLAGVYDGEVFKIYVNGVARPETYSWTGTMFTHNHPTKVGCRGTLGNWFKGALAKLRIYTRALSDAEVKYHFESTRAIFGV